MPIIGAYHEPSPRFIAALPALQEWASLRGIAGTDLEWCWAHFGWLAWEYRDGEVGPTDIFRFPCPVCREMLNPPRAEGFRPAPDDIAPYWLGLCGGCGIAWWF
jgi:hypothetical protein